MIELRKECGKGSHHHVDCSMNKKGSDTHFPCVNKKQCTFTSFHDHFLRNLVLKFSQSDCHCSSFVDISLVLLPHPALVRKTCSLLSLSLLLSLSRTNFLRFSEPTTIQSDQLTLNLLATFSRSILHSVAAKSVFQLISSSSKPNQSLLNAGLNTVHTAE